MAQGFLVLDVGRLLDDSKAGVGAAAQLKEQYEAFQKGDVARQAALEETSGAPRQRAEKELLAGRAKARDALESARGLLREKLLARARPALLALLKERGASVVVSASAVLVYDPDVDVTDQVIKAVDADGPL